MNKLVRQFIEGAARALFVSAWADREEDICRWCGREYDDITTVTGSCDMVDAEGGPCRGRLFKVVDTHLLFGGQNIAEVAPDTPEYVRLEAARLLGKVEQANGMGIEVIITVAHVADHAEHGREDECSFSEFVEQFGWYVAMMAIGTGVSWTDDHAEVLLSGFYCGICTHSSSHDRIHRSQMGPTSHNCSFAYDAGNEEYCTCYNPVCDHKFRVPSFEFTQFNLED